MLGGYGFVEFQVSPAVAVTEPVKMISWAFMVYGPSLFHSLGMEQVIELSRTY